MPTIIAAVATFAAATFTVVGITVTGAFLIKAAIVTAAMAFTYFSAVGAMSLGEQISGRQEMIRQPITARRKVYGSVRVSGPLAYVGTTGTDNKLLYMTILLASHLLSSVGNVYFNDEELSGSKYSSVAQVEKTNTGSDTQASSTLLQEVSEWTANHKLSGIAHLPAKLTFDQEKYSGIPTVKADVQGALIYDPRKDSTNGGAGTHRLATPSTWEYSTNPILCIADYYKDDVVGMGLDTANAIHWPTVITQADICDEVVTKAGGSGTENRYTLNGTVLSNQNPADVLADMLTSCSGTIVNNLEGLIYIYAGAWTTPEVTLTEDDLVGDIQIIDKASRANLFNYVSGTYYNRDTHQPDEFPAVTDAAFVVEDGDDPLRASIELPYTDFSSESQRIANNELMRNRGQTVVVFPANIEALDLIAYDTVYLTLDFYGYTDETFRIIDYVLDIPNGKVLLTLKQEQASDWTWTAGDFSVPGANAASTFPDPYTVSAPTFDTFINSAEIVQDGTVQSSVDLPFAQAADRSILQYEIQYKRSANSAWVPAARVPSPVDAGDASDLTTRVEGLEPDVNYDFRVRGRNYAGNFSAWDEALAHTTSGDVTPPSVPTGLTPTASANTITLNWVNPSEEDFSAIKIYRRTNTTSPSESDLITTLSGDRSKVSRYADDLSDVITYYYWIRSVDRTGNESALTSSVNSAALASDGTLLTEDNSTVLDRSSVDDLEFDFNAANKMDQGDTTLRNIPRGLIPGLARDGDSFTFTPAYDVPPVIQFGSGGIVYDNGNLDDTLVWGQSFRALNLTASGFTASLKLQELAGAPTLRTITGAASPATYDWEGNKSLAAEAWDDKYTFLYDIEVTTGIGEFGQVSFLTNDGGGWEVNDTATHFSDSFGVTVDIFKDGMGLNDDFAMDAFFTLGGTFTGGNDPDYNVTYGTATAGAITSATPIGSTDIPFTVIDNKDAGIVS